MSKGNPQKGLDKINALVGKATDAMSEFDNYKIELKEYKEKVDAIQKDINTILRTFIVINDHLDRIDKRLNISNDNDPRKSDYDPNKQ